MSDNVITGNNVPSSGNVLSGGDVLTGNNIPSTATTPVPPKTPFAWYSAQNVNAGAAQPADASSLATWKDLGSLGSAADCTQATGAAKPTFKLLAQSGKLGNKSSVAFNGSQWMASALFTARNAVTIIGVVFKATNLASSLFVCDGGTGGREGLDWVVTTGQLQMTGAGVANSGVFITAGSYNMVVMSFNGASSSLRLNGVAGSVGNPTPGGMTGVTLGSFIGGGAQMNGELVEYVAYDDLSGVNAGLTAAAVEAYLTAMYGSFPQ